MTHDPRSPDSWPTSIMQVIGALGIVAALMAVGVLLAMLGELPLLYQWLSIIFIVAAVIAIAVEVTKRHSR